jgi:hypothetical protein
MIKDTLFLNAIEEKLYVKELNSRMVRSKLKAVPIYAAKQFRCESGISVSIVCGYGLDDRAIECRCPAEAKVVFL